MNIDEHIKAIEDQGYTIIEQLIGDDVIHRIKRALEPYLQGQLMGRNNFEGEHSERVYALLAKHPDFALIVEHPLIIAILDRLLEPDYLLSANLAINCHAGETPQPFHRDNDGGKNADVTALHGISTIWSFDDFTESNGATEFIAGSHQYVNEPPNPRDIVKAIMPAGSALVFSGSLYHRGGANQSNEPRLAITPQYCQPWLRQLENMVLSVPPEKAAALSSKVQEMLGYSVRSPGFMGYVDGVHPKRLINAEYQGRKAKGLPSINSDLYQGISSNNNTVKG
jgi:ectoine hydroxylase-related dioxygenase (phytanoyl-CoA dioxygenase family)